MPASGGSILPALSGAPMIGTTRSRVSFFMNKFRRLGFVNYNGGGLEVHSSLLNVVLHARCLPPFTPTIRR